VIEEIIEELKTELSEASEYEGGKFSLALLTSKVKGAYRDVKTARHYPASYTEAMIENDMQNYYSQVMDIARYDFNKIGAEGQTSYNQDGVSVHYVERDKLFYGVLPIAIRG